LCFKQRRQHVWFQCWRMLNRILCFTFYRSTDIFREYDFWSSNIIYWVDITSNPGTIVPIRPTRLIQQQTRKICWILFCPQVGKLILTPSTKVRSRPATVISLCAIRVAFVNRVASLPMQIIWGDIHIIIWNTGGAWPRFGRTNP
jgi:hypothetical protein